MEHVTTVRGLVEEEAALQNRQQDFMNGATEAAHELIDAYEEQKALVEITTMPRVQIPRNILSMNRHQIRLCLQTCKLWSTYHTYQYLNFPRLLGSISR